jgi:hypothetical protein
MASTKLDSSTISKITQRESAITGTPEPTKGGPTAQAQKHVGESISGDAVSDIVQGERKITGKSGPMKDGPASVVQSEASQNQVSMLSPSPYSFSLTFATEQLIPNQSHG